MKNHIKLVLLFLLAVVLTRCWVSKSQHLKTETELMNLKKEFEAFRRSTEMLISDSLLVEMEQLSKRLGSFTQYADSIITNFDKVNTERIEKFDQQVDQHELNIWEEMLEKVLLMAFQFYLKPYSLGGAGRDASAVIDNKEQWFPKYTYGLLAEDVKVYAEPGFLCVAEVVAPIRNKKIIMKIDDRGRITR
ncbi:MAG: hypothetical protein PHR06_02075 [Candidatus Cloacimonetes bacterium]|nr:hypothetical protein [Candidatus Cloacimonadota bacterium]